MNRFHEDKEIAEAEDFRLETIYAIEFWFGNHSTVPTQTLEGMLDASLDAHSAAEIRLTDLGAIVFLRLLSATHLLLPH